MPNLVEKPGNLGSLEVAFEVNWKLMSTCGIAVLSTLCTLYCLMISFIDLVQQASNLKLNSKSRDFFTIMTFSPIFLAIFKLKQVHLKSRWVG